MRGKQLFTGKLNSNFRITPAGAGKTTDYCPILPELEDHPRRCGENLMALLLERLLRGSPPQVRGKLAD